MCQREGGGLRTHFFATFAQVFTVPSDGGEHQPGWRQSSADVRHDKIPRESEWTHATYKLNQVAVGYGDDPEIVRLYLALKAMKSGSRGRDSIKLVSEWQKTVSRRLKLRRITLSWRKLSCPCVA